MQAVEHRQPPPAGQGGGHTRGIPISDPNSAADPLNMSAGVRVRPPPLPASTLPGRTEQATRHLSVICQVTAPQSHCSSSLHTCIPYPLLSSQSLSPLLGASLYLSSAQHNHLLPLSRDLVSISNQSSSRNNGQLSTGDQVTSVATGDDPEPLLLIVFCTRRLFICER